MEIPLVVCYPTEYAIEILRKNGIEKIETIKTCGRKSVEEFHQPERVICQRVRNDAVQLIVS